MSDDSMALGYALGQDSNNGGGNDGMWGGNGSWIFAFLIIALIFGGNGWGNWGGNGGNGAGYQGAVTRSDPQVRTKFLYRLASHNQNLLSKPGECPPAERISHMPQQVLQPQPENW
jgi:hypothetical protein